MVWFSPVVLAGILGLGLVTSLVLAQSPRKTVMVVDFADRAGNWSEAREAVTLRVIAKLRGDQVLRVLPRDRVQGALQQPKLETEGFIEWEDAQKVAKALEADYAIMGEVTSFDQQQTGGCLPVVGCTYTTTASVSLQGKVLDVSTGRFIGEPKATVTKQQGSASISVGAEWGSVSLENLDSQLIGKATLEAVDKFVGEARPYLK